nr:sphingomyelin synthase family protein [Mucilaginibacter segetis]
MAALKAPDKRFKILTGTVLIFIVLSTLPAFFGHIEKREGIVLNDWLLAHIPAYNVSVIIFAIIWGIATLTVIRALYNPDIYIKYVWTLLLINIARIISIELVALNPPKGLIRLSDPLTGIFYGNANITKDLFFSGHTAILVLIFLCLEKRSDKIVCFIGIITVAILLLIQHIHYSIDVLAAPVIVYILFTITSYFLKLDKPVKLQATPAVKTI